MALSAEFMFHHADLCLFHQMHYRAASEKDDLLNKRAAALRDAVTLHPPADDWDDIQVSRNREAIYADALAYSRALLFADHLLLVGLWAAAEQYCNRALSMLARIRGRPAPPRPDAWPKMRKVFRELGLDIVALDKYADVDECRLVNNEIKHSGVVTERLAALPHFRVQLGKPLTKVEIPLQRYANAVLVFVTHVMSEVGEFAASERPDPTP
jgi:hypothetical protein